MSTTPYMVFLRAELSRVIHKVNPKTPKPEVLADAIFDFMKRSLFLYDEPYLMKKYLREDEYILESGPTVDTLLNEMCRYVENSRKKAEVVNVRIGTVGSYDNTHDVLFVLRRETPEELKKRLAAEERAVRQRRRNADSAREKRRKAYLKLKAEFEGKEA